MIRTIYIVQKNSIGYAYGFQGIGDKATEVYMLQKAFPGLAPVYGLVASLMFSIAYSFSNVFMSFQSKNWNKKTMLVIGVLGFSLSTSIAGASQNLVLFASMRFLFGCFASAINTPIY